MTAIRISSFEEFELSVKAAGLMPRACSDSHWQIRGGGHLVNCWPSTRRGFVVQVDGQKSRLGSTAMAIQLADGRAKAKPLATKETPPWQEVGLIRRFWRWIW